MPAAMTDLTLPLVIGAALADSINPCVIGVLIFLVAFMTKVFKSSERMLVGGIIYTAVVYVTYLLLGLGILAFTVSYGFSVAFYWVAAIIAIGAGLLEIKDFFSYGKGFSLQLLPGSAMRIKKYTQYIADAQKKHIFYSYLIAGLLGVFVVFVELPCTGAPYLAILGLLSQGQYENAVPLLLLYNLVFVLPLLIIIGIAYFGTSSKMLETWRKEHRGLLRLFVGLFLIALGVYMLFVIT